MWKIYAPVKGVTGTWASVRFVNGIGETANPALAEWFRQHNYRVEKCDTTTQIPMEKCDEPDFEAMTPNELREWMKANGYGLKIKNIRNKEKLLDILRG